ncbi:MAG: fibronectin type III domain-containing protein [Micrococcales bacterium]|nr:fibronectin type III domain-containing protein [Micrococcales bacterium]
MKKLGLLISAALAAVAIAPGLPAFALDAPSNVAVVTNSAADAATNAGAAKVTWTAVAAADAYTVVATSAGQTTRTGSTASCANNTCTSYVSDLTGGQAYEFVVTSLDTGTNTQAAATGVNFTAQTIPTAPTVSAPTVADGQVTLTWGAPTSTGGLPITEYVVTDGSGNTATKAAGSSTHTFTGLTNGTGYTFTVKAKNALGYSQATSFSLATPVSVPSTPAKPSVSGSLGSVTATWTAPATGGSAITGYKVYLLKSGVAASSDEAVDSGTFTKTFSGLTDGSYTVQVIATNSIGDSPRSNQSNAVALGSSLSQSITFNAPADKTLPGSFTLTATATSGLAVSFASTTSATCTVSGSTLTLVSAGSCSITASQAGDGTYNAATDVVRAFTITAAAAPPSGGGGGGGGGGGYVAPVDSTPAMTAASLALTADTAVQKTLLGSNLGLVTAAKVGTTSATVLEASSGYLILGLPALDAGVYSLTLTYGSSTKTFSNFVVVAEKEAAVVAPTPSSQKVNAGSFKGYVAVYAKGYEGQRLSAKIGKDWVIVPALKSRFERITDFTGKGYQIRVRIYIDRVLEATINLTTK